MLSLSLGYFFCGIPQIFSLQMAQTNSRTTDDASKQQCLENSGIICIMQKSCTFVGRRK